jgi:nitrate reductase gamma subunit
MNFWVSLISAGVVVLILIAIGALGAVPALQGVFGVAVPILAVLIFVAGIVWRVVQYARRPVPFAIPTTCGQQKTLPWIKNNPVESPNSTAGVVARMALEILTFRSLFRNTAMKIGEDGPKITYGSTQWLWLGAIVFHYAFLTVVIRHMRFFTDPVWSLVHAIETFDGFLEVGLPGMMLSGFALLAAVGYLLLRRLAIPQLRYISLPNDYFPLFLILSIAGSGILMRYFVKVDVIAVKELAMNIAHFNFAAPEGIGILFWIHLFLVCVLLAYFPFSKLIHSGGVFFSPTRNMATNTREFRHINPWNYPVKIHTYEAYEDEFREKMVEAGLPVDKPLDDEAAAQ